MKSINLAKFGPGITQLTAYHCIPATIEGMLKYHDPSLTIHQSQIMAALQSMGTNRQPSFGAAEKANQQIAKSMKFKVLNPKDVNAWSQNMKDEIDQGRPLAISTNVAPGSFHIRSVLGYDDDNEYYLLHNPGLHILGIPSTSPPQSIAIIGGLEVYLYSDSKSDWKRFGGGTDQLQIIP